MENSMSLTCKGTWGSEVGAKEGPHILHLSSSWDPSVCYWMFGGPSESKLLRLWPYLDWQACGTLSNKTSVTPLSPYK